MSAVLRSRWAVATVAVLLVTAFVVAAVREDGYRSDHVTLHDSGIWVMKDDQQLGRFNYDLQLVDTKSVVFDPIADIHQSDSTLVVQTASSKLFAYNVSLNRSDGEGNIVPDGTVVSIGGENGAVLDPETGKVWFTDRSGVASIAVSGAKESPGSAVLEGADRIVVGADGVLHVVSTKRSVMWTFSRPFSTGGPTLVPVADAQASTSDPTAATAPPLPDGPELTDEELAGTPIASLDGLSQLTAAGPRAVALVDRSLVVEDEEPIDLPSVVGADPVVQHPSVEPDSVLVASSTGLHRVFLDGGATEALQEGDHTEAIAPVWIAGCAYAAWNDVVFSSCSRPTLADAPQPSAVGAVFRTNRDLVALNYRDGTIVAFPKGDEMRTVDDTWSDALDPNKEDDSEQSTDPIEEPNRCEVPTRNTAPIVPESPDFVVRAGQSTTLTVLDPPGDTATPASDPDCDVLTVSLNEDDGLADGEGVVSVVNDGRALQYQPPAGVENATVSVPYVVSDGADTVEATANVTVVPADSVGSPPTAKTDRSTVEVGKTVVVDVLANDTDADGDALRVVSVEAPDPSDGFLVWQPGGRFAYTAPGSGAGSKTISYTVQDASGLQANGVLDVAVISIGVKAPPNPRTDARLGMMAPSVAALRTFDVNVLANDSDPNGDALRVTEVAAYPLGSGPKAVLADDGTVSITPDEPGAYNYVYTVVDTQGEVAQSRIRFDIQADRGRSAPIAVRDAVVVNTRRPTVVDLLRNDTDLNGDLMMVTDVAVPDLTAEDLNVEVIENRVVRISARRSQPRATSYSFSYTVSDGAQQSTATVSVAIAPDGTTQPPVTIEDRAQVHLGGYVSLPVLVNDFDPNGIPLVITDVQLDDKVAAGGDPGVVFSQANQVRYVPPTPESRPSPFTVTGTYTVSNGRDRTNGRFTIEVTDPAAGNRPPSSAPAGLRTFQEVPVELSVPSFGLDPDGDPVELVALDGAPPSKGTIELDDAGTTLTYTPLPGVTGSDSFRWQLRDSYDAIGYLDVRVVIAPLPPGNTPPVAVADTAQVQAGQVVFIPVLANDTDQDPGDKPEFDLDRPFDQPNAGAGVVSAADDPAFLRYEAPSELGEYSFIYFITDGKSPPVAGLVTVTVTTEDQLQNKPPLVRDVVLKPYRPGDLVEVDLAPLASDPDGQALTFGPGADAEAVGATVDGATLQLTMGERPLIVTFLADDGLENGRARGVIQIPTPKNRAPKADTPTIPIGADETTKRITLSDELFTDPDGDPVVIKSDTQPTVSPPEASNGGDMSFDGNSFMFNRNPDFGGSAQIVYYILDDPAVGEPIIQAATVVLQIERVVNETPIADDGTVDVISGSSSQFDLSSLVSDPDIEDRQNLTIGDVSPDLPSELTMSVDGAVLTFEAPINAVAEGSTLTGTVTYTVDDGKENGSAQGTLEVVVKPTNLDKPVAVDDLEPAVKQGESPTWNLTANDPPNGAGTYRIVSVTQPDIATVSIVSESSVRFSPTPNTSGQTSFTYTIEDDAKRQATATVRVAVKDRPDVPEQPTVGEQLSSTAVVTFSLGADGDNGAPIDGYEVVWSGGRQLCEASPCTINGLTNGTEYTFQVRAHNEVGWGELSAPSGPYTPDELPGTPPIAQADWNDRSARVTWGKIPNDGSDIIDVTVSVQPADVAPKVVAGGEGGGFADFDGLTNGTAYTFTLVARNKKDKGPSSEPSTPVVPAGPPSLNQQPIFSATNGLVTVLWPAADGNGDDNLTYTVKLTNETTGVTTNTDVGATLNTQLAATNGNVYHAVINVQNKYTLRYANAGVDSPPSASAKPIGPPFAPGSVTATAGPGNGAVNLSWSAADPNGGTLNQYQVSVNGGGWQNVGTSTAATISSGLSLGTSYTFRVRALNDNSAGEAGAASSPSNVATPYTPPASPSVSCGESSNYVITCSWSVGALNGPGPQTVSVTGATSSSASSGNWSSGMMNRGNSAGITVRVCNGGAGNNCSQNSSSASTRDHRAFSTYRGGYGGVCPVGGGSCYRIGYSLSGFFPGTYTVTCFTGQLSGYSFTVNVPSNGSVSGETNRCWAANYANTALTTDGLSASNGGW